MQGMTVYPIRFISEFKNFYRIAINNLKNIGNKKNDNISKSNCHMIISLQVKKLDIINDLSREVPLAKMNLVKLADSDDIEKNEEFQILSKYLLQCSQTTYRLIRDYFIKN